MDFLIFSDSHGRGANMLLALQRQIYFPRAIFFTGDGVRDLDVLSSFSGEVYAVRGNCDRFAFGAFGEIPTLQTVFFEGHRILLTHGHEYGVKGGYGALLSYAAKSESDIVLFGHTHCPIEKYIPAGERLGNVVLQRPLYLFNPGSIADGSFGTLSLQKDQVLFSHGTI